MARRDGCTGSVDISVLYDAWDSDVKSLETLIAKVDVPNVRT
jgi:hypothetical protein